MIGCEAVARVTEAVSLEKYSVLCSGDIVHRQRLSWKCYYEQWHLVLCIQTTDLFTDTPFFIQKWEQTQFIGHYWVTLCTFIIRLFIYMYHQGQHNSGHTLVNIVMYSCHMTNCLVMQCSCTVCNIQSPVLLLKIIRCENKPVCFSVLFFFCGVCASICITNWA